MACSKDSGGANPDWLSPVVLFGIMDYDRQRGVIIGKIAASLQAKIHFIAKRRDT
jgi:hypothetical protein